ncbi:MAG: ABC transporter substrate-binding protein [Desulfobulbaceae bacterium]|nr:ABC transporter substrate-binding protein [Desulfobulbaceae bacterium]
MKKSVAALFFVICLTLILPVQGRCKEDGAIVRICYPNKAQYAPFILAKETNAWEKSGLVVKNIVIAGGGIEVAEALVAGEADVAAMGDAPALIAVSRNGNLKILTSYMTSENMHRLIVSQSSNIAKPSDLAGKKIAVHVGTSTYGALLLYLKKHGIDKKEVTFVTIPPQFFPEAMQKGEVDAVAGSEPWPQNVLDKNPTARQLTTLGGLGNTYPHLILGRADFLQASQEKSKAILRVIADMESMLRDRPEEAARLIAQATGRPWQKELAALSELQWSSGVDETIRQSLLQTAGFLIAEGKLKKMPDLKAAIQEQE